jgi:hypothetical protein
MANTRNRVATDNAENNAGNNNNQDAKPPPPPSAYSWTSAGYASTNASDHAADHGQPTCSTPRTTATEGYAWRVLVH